MRDVRIDLLSLRLRLRRYRTEPHLRWRRTLGRLGPFAVVRGPFARPIIGRVWWEFDKWPENVCLWRWLNRRSPQGHSLFSPPGPSADRGLGVWVRFVERDRYKRFIKVLSKINSLLRYGFLFRTFGVNVYLGFCTPSFSVVNETWIIHDPVNFGVLK